MAKHMWVQVEMTPVTIEPGNDGKLEIFVTEDAQEAAGDDVRFGCWFCDELPNLDNLNSECPQTISTGE